MEVNKTELKIHKLFHRTQSVSVFDIKNVRIGEKQDVTLYDMDDKKVLTVDASVSYTHLDVYKRQIYIAFYKIG